LASAAKRARTGEGASLNRTAMNVFRPRKLSDLRDARSVDALPSSVRRKGRVITCVVRGCQSGRLNGV
jgi:hypothetical protein